MVEQSKSPKYPPLTEDPAFIKAVGIPLMFGLVFILVGWIFRDLALQEGIIGGVLIGIAILVWMTPVYRTKAFRLIGWNMGNALIVCNGNQVKTEIIGLNYEIFDGLGGTYNIDQSCIQTVGGIPTLVYTLGNPDPWNFRFDPNITWTSEKVSTVIKAQNVLAQMKAMSQYHNYLVIILICSIVAVLGTLGSIYMNNQTQSAVAQAQYFCQAAANATQALAVKVGAMPVSVITHA